MKYDSWGSLEKNSMYHNESLSAKQISVNFILILTPCMLVCADNLFKQFGLRSGQTKHNVRPDLDPHFLTLMVFLKGFFENFN